MEFDEKFTFKVGDEYLMSFFSKQRVFFGM